MCSRKDSHNFRALFFLLCVGTFICLIRLELEGNSLARWGSSAENVSIEFDHCEAYVDEINCSEQDNEDKMYVVHTYAACMSWTHVDKVC